MEIRKKKVALAAVKIPQNEILFYLWQAHSNFENTSNLYDAMVQKDLEFIKYHGHSQYEKLLGEVKRIT